MRRNGKPEGVELRDIPEFAPGRISKGWAIFFLALLAVFGAALMGIITF